MPGSPGGAASGRPGHRPDIDALYARIRAGLPGLAAELQERLGSGWTVEVDPGGRSHPRVHLEGPSDDDGRRVTVALTPVRCRADTFHATVGASMLAGDLDEAQLTEPAAEAAVEPAWITRVRALGETAEAWAAGRNGAGRHAAEGSGLVRISARPGGGTRGPAAAKLALADRFWLPRRYAKGRPEEFLGVRTEPVPGEDFAEFVREVAALAVRLDTSGTMAGT